VNIAQSVPSPLITGSPMTSGPQENHKQYTRRRNPYNRQMYRVPLIAALVLIWWRTRVGILLKDVVTWVRKDCCLRVTDIRGGGLKGGK